MTDLYLRENVKSRPTFARDLSSSKDFVREFFQKEEKTPEHLSGYEGYDSRQMAKNGPFRAIKRWNLSAV